MGTEYKINPQAVEVTVGVRRLWTITIYPLSVGDQLKLTNEVADSIASYLDKSNALASFTDPDVDMNEEQIGSLVLFITNLLKENLEKVLEFVVDEKWQEESTDLLSMITNAQAIEIINLVFDMNFGYNLKNAKRLFEKVKNLFMTDKKESTELSQQSVNGMGTKSEISSDPSEEAA